MLLQGPDGKVAEIDVEGRLRTFAVVTSEDKHLNLEGNVFSSYINVTPAGANDYFYYLKNTGFSDLNVTDIRITSTVATMVTYEIVSGTPTYTAATDSPLTNRNLGSANTLAAIAKQDTNITGLTSEGVVFFESVAVANTMYSLRTTSNIIIPQGKAIAFKRVAATGTITCVVSIVDSAT